MPSIRSLIYNTSRDLGTVESWLSLSPERVITRQINKTLMGVPLGLKIGIALAKPGIRNLVKKLERRKEVQVWRIYDSVKLATDVIYKKAILNTPIQTGNLVKSIRYTYGHPIDHPDWLEGHVVWTAPYGLFVEHGTRRTITPKESRVLAFRSYVKTRIGVSKNVEAVPIVKSGGMVFTGQVKGQKAQHFARNTLRQVTRKIVRMIHRAARPRTVEPKVVGKVPSLPVITKLRTGLYATGRFIGNINPWVRLAPGKWPERRYQRVIGRRITQRLSIRRRIRR